MKYPELKGTSAQVSWAEKIRKITLAKITKKEIKQFFLTETDSNFFINNRLCDIEELESAIYKKMIDSSDDAKDVKNDNIIFPINKKTATEVELLAEVNKIVAKFDKNKYIRDILKAYGYRWSEKNMIWYLRPYHDIKDHIAEIGNILLNKGIPIIIHDKEIANMAKKGIFKPSSSSVIYYDKLENDEYISIRWKKGGLDYFSVLKKIPSSTWNNNRIKIKAKYYKEIMDFADFYSFEITDEAKLLMLKYKKIFDVSEKVVVSNIEEKGKEKKSFNTSIDRKNILDDLIDND